MKENAHSNRTYTLEQLIWNSMQKEEIYKEEGQNRRIEVNNGAQEPKGTVHLDRTHIIFIVLLINT